MVICYSGNRKRIHQNFCQIQDFSEPKITILVFSLARSSTTAISQMSAPVKLSVPRTQYFFSLLLPCICQLWLFHNKVPQTVQPKQQTFLTVLGARKLKTKVPAHSVPSEDLLPGFQKATYSLCSPMVEKERALISSYSYKTLILTWRPHLHELI